LGFPVKAGSYIFIFLELSLSGCRMLHNTVGLKSDGTVVATGDNYYGQYNVSGWDLN